MWGILATDPRIKSRLYGAFALAVSLGLAGCSDLDNALFSDEPDNGGAPAASADQFPPATAPGTAGTLPAAPATAATGSAPVIAITPVTIEPGANTGTAVSATIAAMRSQLSTSGGTVSCLYRTRQRPERHTPVAKWRADCPKLSERGG